MVKQAVVGQLWKRLRGLAAVAALASLVVPGDAAAATTDGASCVARATMTYAATSPGPSRENWTSQEPSTIECAGDWGGVKLAGGGTYTSSGTYASGSLYLPREAVCLTGSGRGMFRASVPIVGLWGGDVVLRATYEFVQIASTRYLTGTGTAEFHSFSAGNPRPEVHVEEFILQGVGQVVPGPGVGCLTAGMAGATTIEELELTPDGPGSPDGESEPGAAEDRVACAREQSGSRRADRLTGTSGGDSIGGRAGNDTIRGLAGPDCLRGDGGNDRVAGGFGGDLLTGGPGADALTGGPGSDALSGGRGSDLINAGPGDDRIDTADGLPDRLRCGRGTDEARTDRSDRVSGCERVVMRRS